MSKYQKIKIKRTPKSIAQLSSTTIDYGEPLYFKDNYFMIGKGDNSTIGSNKVVKFYDTSLIEKNVFYTGTPEKAQLIEDDGTQLHPLTTADNVTYKNGSTVEETLNNILDPNTGVAYSEYSAEAELSNKLKTSPGTNTNYYLLGTPDLTDGGYKDIYHAGPNANASKNVSGVYYTASGVLMSAAWNDYAEGRTCKEEVLPGTCVVEDGEGNVVCSTKYLQPAAGIVSDTYGMLIGADYEDAKPIAVAGRVLAYVEPHKKLKVGDALKTAPFGRLARMTRREIKKYPDRIVGIVSEFPKYDKWQDISVNGRIWIKVK